MAASTRESPAATGEGSRFSFGQPVVTLREDEVAARVVIRRSGDISGAASVAWWTSEGTAIASEDYADAGARIERFEPGEARRSVYVPVINDSIAETTKSFNVHLRHGRGTPVSSVRIDIADDD
jgi:hypothetical protein